MKEKRNEKRASGLEPFQQFVVIVVIVGQAQAAGGRLKALVCP